MSMMAAAGTKMVGGLAGITFASDTLDDTDGVLISSHAASDGGSWTRNTGSGGTSAPRFITNRVRNSENQIHVWYHSAVPAQTDYEITAKIRVVSSAVSGGAGPFLMDVTNAVTGYLFMPDFAPASDGYYLYRVAAGVKTEIGNYIAVPNSSVTYTLALRRQAGEIKAYHNGVLRITVADATYTNIGRAGIWIQGTASDVANQHVEEFTSATYV
jgi:hypothetical protein